MARLLQSPKELPRPHVRLVLIYLVVILLGLGMTSGRMPGAGDAGRVTIVVGVGGCAWELAQWLRATRKRLAARAQARARGELKAVRAVRRRQEQAQNRRQKQTQLHATRKHAQIRQAEQQAKQRHTLNLEAQRAARFQTIAAEAARLQALPDTHLLTELPAIFAARGLRLQNKTPILQSAVTENSAASVNSTPINNTIENTINSSIENPMNTSIENTFETIENLWNYESNVKGEDMRFMRLSDETLEIARCLPQGQTVTVADVEALEQWRQSCEASHAYLIGRNGFSAAAIRLAQRFALTLVEPQLLAQWYAAEHHAQATTTKTKY